MKSMTTVVGELQGIAQDSFPELGQIDSLEVLALPTDDASSEE